MKSNLKLILIYTGIAALLAALTSPIPGTSLLLTGLEVFMIVHRRLDTFDRNTRITTWLFGICMRVAANYRRRRRWALEVPAVDSNDDRPSMVVAADDLLARREERHLAEWALSRLNIEKRATFVMFEVESLSCEEIAKIMNVPVGTVYSRLHTARRQLEKVVARNLRRRR